MVDYYELFWFFVCAFAAALSAGVGSGSMGIGLSVWFGLNAIRSAIAIREGKVKP